MKLSIIVPVYNMAADNRLTFCLDSLLAQTLDQGEYEIIAVDDCSTDESPAILKRYEEAHPGRVRVILSEVNRHQGGAKNLGIRAAKGDWIGFIDADDWISPDMYECMLEEAEETGADMVGCDLTLVDHHTYETGEIIEKNGSEEQTGVLDHEKKKRLILDGGRLVLKIFRRETVLKNELFFPENIFYEDNAMSSSYLLTAKKYAYIPRPMYYYYQHEGSTVHSFSEQRCRDRMAAGRMILSEAKRLGFYDEFLPEIEFTFTQLFFVNTLFTYMPRVKPARPAFVGKLAAEMKETFPNFRENSYYQEKTNAEEKKLIDMACSSPIRFFIYYKLLWGYRNLRKGLKSR
ncbi:MAG: glycosyltransferase [Lachnospiraceae bacterium]|nr:glycosyltransferase [Lachnospiraceae bacterium]